MKTFEYIEVQKSRDFGQILTVTFKFLGQNFKNFSKSLLFITAIPLIITILFSNYMLSDYMYDPQTIFNHLPEYFLNIMINVLISMFATVFITIIPVIYVKIYQVKKTSDISVNEVWNYAKKLFVKIYLAELGIALIVGIATLFFIIPGIYVGIAFSLVPVIIVLEESSFSESLGRSSRLISGHWWLTLGLILILYLILMVLTSVLSLPLYIITFISALSSPNPEMFIQPDWKMKIATAISSLSYLFYSLFTLALTFHYYSLKEKKEATGLFEKIDNINPENNENLTVG